MLPVASSPTTRRGNSKDWDSHRRCQAMAVAARGRASGGTCWVGCCASTTKRWHSAADELFERHTPRRLRILDLLVSSESRECALRLIDALFKAAEARGNSVMRRSDDQDGALVVISGQPVWASVKRRYD